MTTQEKEQVQDVIDRLLYLNETERKHFDRLLSDLIRIFPIQCEIIDGIRVYKINTNGK